MRSVTATAPPGRQPVEDLRQHLAVALHLLGHLPHHAADPLIEVGQPLGQHIDNVAHVIACAEGGDVALTAAGEQVQLDTEGADFALHLAHQDAQGAQIDGRVAHAAALIASLYNIVIP
jgi:hypothetical protein